MKAKLRIWGGRGVGGGCFEGIGIGWGWGGVISVDEVDEIVAAGPGAGVIGMSGIGADAGKAMCGLIEEGFFHKVIQSTAEEEAGAFAFKHWLTRTVA